jgi:hypothetical protein
MRERDGAWVARYPIRLAWRGDRVSRVRDYVHVSYVLADARVEL